VTIGPHAYRHIDDDSKLKVELSTRELAERISRMNYGVHRFLSHLVDVRREELARRIDMYRKEGRRVVADMAEADGDRMADGIEKLLLEGLY
jgi:hypothetical protein